jgi:hypothetical protein
MFMNKPSQEERRIRQYLLGTLDAKQRELLEERFLSDDDLLDEVAMIENEVVSDYLAGTLSTQEKEQFQNHFLLVPGRQQKLEFFVALTKNAASQPRPISQAHLPVSWKRFFPAFLRGESPLLRYAFGAVVLALFLGGMAGLLRNWRAHGPVSEYPQLATYTVTLSPGQGRAVGAEDISRVHLSDSTGMVTLRLLLTENNYQNYRATLLTDEGVKKFTQDGLSAHAAAGATMIDVGIPNEILMRGDYQLRLDGRTPGRDFEVLNSYFFRVIRD